jgi:ribonuclease III
MENPGQFLAKRLGYQFKDKELLQLALTHRSVSGKNNERLEFLGDSLLNFIIAEALCRLYPDLKEGELSRLRANLVNGTTLAELAREFNLGDCLILGIGELRSGGFQRESILADTLEAIIAAIYIDSNIDTCRERLLKWYDSRLIDPRALDKLKDPKTMLQEYCQSHQMALPLYTILSIQGEAHAQIFHVQCQVPGFDIITNSVDTTRRRAEQKAAQEFLSALEKQRTSGTPQ